jgi:Ca2+-binding RTX toxin-like protein
MRVTSYNQIIDSLWSDRLTGTSGSDYVELTWGNDTAYGGAGSDVIWDLDGHYQNQYPGNPGDHIWLASNDLIHGGDGDDWVFAGWGADSIYGGAGHDRLDYGYSKSGVEVNLILGRGYGDDRSASKGDVISGFEEIAGSFNNDLFFLGASRVTIQGGRGDDRIYGGTGAATVDGGEGNDTMFAGAGAVSFTGGAGVDTLSFALSTGARSHHVGPDSGIEVVAGSGLGDTLSASVDYGGTVTLRGEGGDDVLGIPHVGSFTGGKGSLYGGSGNDRLTGALNADWLDGGSGHDSIDGSGGDDMILGGTGNDILRGGSGRDALFGGDGDDILRGESGGGESGGGERLYGGAGQDRLDGGRASATLFGGGGADTFVFSADTGARSAGQRIADIERGTDRIDISAIDARPDGTFTSFQPGLAGDQAFVFMGLAGKSAPAGTATYHHAGGDTVVSLHVNSDAIADFRIVLTGLHTLTAADFVL